MTNKSDKRVDTNEIQLDFFVDVDMLRSRRPQKAVRRSRVVRLRSDRARALAPTTDLSWFELPPMEAYADMLNLKQGELPPEEDREAPGDPSKIIPIAS